jgi:opacity protein-like surface antigen
MASSASLESLCMVKVAVFAFVLLVSSAASAQSGARTPPESAAKSAPASEPEPSSSLAGFDILASVGYGHTTTTPSGLKFEPYGAVLGLDLGYTFGMGLRIGARTSYGLGRKIAQSYDRLVGPNIDLTSAGSSLTTSATIGYDLKLSVLVLRHSFGVGFTWLHWDLGDIPYDSFAGYSPMKGSGFGGLIDPGIALLWQVSHFECGVSVHYFVPFTDLAPDAVVAELLVGTHL